MTTNLTQRYGKTALVTGASSGIGKAFAEQLAVQGFDLVVVARRESLLNELKEQLSTQHSGEVRVVAADLSRADGIETVLAAVGEEGVDLLVSNAGFGLKGGFADADRTHILQMIHTNAIAPTVLCHALLPKMKKRGRGGVIITGSVEGEAGFPWSTAYAATKAFVHSLGGGLWGEYRGTGVDILVLAPGPTDTDAPKLQGISEDQMSGVMSPERVAREALEALGSRPLLIPGWLNRLMIRVIGWMPRAVALKMTGAGMKRAIENSRGADAA